MSDYPFSCFVALLFNWVLPSALFPSSRFAFGEALFAPVLNPTFVDSRFSSPVTAGSFELGTRSFLFISTSLNSEDKWRTIKECPWLQVITKKVCWTQNHRTSVREILQIYEVIIQFTRENFGFTSRIRSFIYKENSIVSQHFKLNELKSIKMRKN